MAQANFPGPVVYGGNATNLKVSSLLTGAQAWPLLISIGLLALANGLAAASRSG